jgi:hypothetical protein
MSRPLRGSKQKRTKVTKSLNPIFVILELISAVQKICIQDRIHRLIPNVRVISQSLIDDNVMSVRTQSIGRARDFPVVFRIRGGRFSDSQDVSLKSLIVPDCSAPPGHLI